MNVYRTTILFVTIIFLSVNVASENLEMWKPKNASANSSILSFKVKDNRAVMLSLEDLEKLNKDPALHLLDISEESKPQILATLSLEEANYTYFDHPIELDFTDKYIYFMPAGGYATSLFVVEISSTNTMEIKEIIKLFPEHNFKTYIEFPSTVFIEEGRLYAGQGRGFTVFDISTPERAKKPHKIQEVDGCRLLGAKGNSVFLATRFGGQVVDVTKPISLNLSFSTNSENHSMNTINHIGQSSTKILFHTSRYKEKGQFYELIMVNIPLKSDNPIINFKEWETKIEHATLSDEYLVISTAQELEIYNIDQGLTELKELKSISYKEIMTKQKDYTSSARPAIKNNYVYVPLYNFGLGIVKINSK